MKHVYIRFSFDHMDFDGPRQQYIQADRLLIEIVQGDKEYRESIDGDHLVVDWNSAATYCE